MLSGASCSVPSMRTGICLSKWGGGLLFTVAFLFLAACQPKSHQRESQNPKRISTGVNVLLITIDTLRPDYLTCYGKARAATPWIDRLAASGVRFNQAFAQVPLTPPSHASIMTGTYPSKHKVRDLEGFKLDDRIPTLASCVKSAGFHTAAVIGSAMLHRRCGLNKGFDVYFDDMKDSSQHSQSQGEVAELRGEVVTRRALEWLTGLPKEKGAESSQRFFLWAHYFDPHFPYNPPEPYRSRYANDVYAGEVAYVDAQIGELLNGLTRLGLEKTTLVALLSDHGESLGEHGESTHGVFLYDSTMHIPWVMAGPGLPGHRVIDDQVRTIDVMPTILEYLGLSQDRKIQGLSVLPAILEGRSFAAQFSYMETIYPKTHLGWSELRGLRTKDWKLIDAPKPELYKISDDAGETKNVVAQFPSPVRELRQKMREAADNANGTEHLEIQASSDEKRRQLQSLGYASAGTPRRIELDFSGSDPKDRIHILARIGKADLLMVQNRFREATIILEESLREDSTNPLIYRQMGFCLQQAGQLKRAIQLYQQAIQRGADNDQTHAELGTVYMQLGDKLHAMESMEEAALQNPLDLGNLGNLATIYLELARTADCQRVLRTILGQKPDHAVANNLSGVLSVQQGQKQMARRYFEKAVQGDPDFAQAYMNLGILNEEAGQASEAVSCYRKFLEKTRGMESRDIIRKVKKAITDLERKS